MYDQKPLLIQIIDYDFLVIMITSLLKSTILRSLTHETHSPFKIQISNQPQHSPIILLESESNENGTTRNILYECLMKVFIFWLYCCRLLNSDIRGEQVHDFIL